MSISVNKVSKIYGSQRAVDQLSFTASKGHVMGFLGPNGAGKSTTMKMIVGYIEPSEGDITVCGMNVLENPIEVKKQIGYLPEHNPLYKEMYVKEYLNFISGFLNTNKPRAQRVAEVIDITGLGPEQHKKIKTLSKGYRQRVGLAQAIYHDPEVIILDEPTTGLDPNQLVEIRKLIKDLGRDKTVILSTHIMQEVSALCDQVVIINQGKLIADEKIGEIQYRLEGNNIVDIELTKPMNTAAIEQIAQVTSVNKLSDTQYRIYYKGQDIRAQIFNAIVANQGVLIGMSLKEMSIEEIFQKLTQ